MVFVDFDLKRRNNGLFLILFGNVESILLEQKNKSIIMA